VVLGSPELKELILQWGVLVRDVPAGFYKTPKANQNRTVKNIEVRSVS